MVEKFEEVKGGILSGRHTRSHEVSNTVGKHPKTVRD